MYYKKNTVGLLFIYLFFILHKPGLCTGVCRLFIPTVIKWFMPSRTLESLCQEMVEEGLLKQASSVRMQDYLGKS